MDNLKRVFSADKLYRANIIREKLAEEGIESFEINQKGSAFLMGEIHIYVSSKDYEKAMEIVKEHQDI